MSDRYEPRTVREWFVRDRRGARRQCEDEADARWLAAQNPAAEGVVLWRDVTYGPLTEADR